MTSCYESTTAPLKLHYCVWNDFMDHHDPNEIMPRGHEAMPACTYLKSISDAIIVNRVLASRQPEIIDFIKETSITGKSTSVQLSCQIPTT